MAEGHGGEAYQIDPIDRIIQGVDPTTLTTDGLDDLIDQHPVAQELAHRLKDVRDTSKLSFNADRAYVDNIIHVRGNIGEVILKKLGITSEEDEIVLRRREAQRLHALAEVSATVYSRDSEDIVLAKYGLLDNEGRMTRESIDSPLFREDTKRSFRTYTSYAIQFDAMEQAEEFAGVPLKNTVQASNLRKDAHDAVAHLVVRDLGLSFDIARRFVAKMREQLVPGSHEKTSYATLLKGEKIATQFGNDALAFTQDRLKSIIHEPMPHENSDN